MIIKRLTQIGDPVLKKKTKEIKNFESSAVKKVIKDLIDSLYYHELVGIAAPQIGSNLRVFVTEVRKTSARNPKNPDRLRVYINPKIIKFSAKKSLIYEGCGSVADANLFGPVKRPENIVIEAYDQEGKKFQLQANDLLARVIQHEQDHLDGMEFLEKLTDIREAMTKSEYIKRILNKSK